MKSIKNLIPRLIKMRKREPNYKNKSTLIGK